MKRVFYLLLLVNAAYFSWQVWHFPLSTDSPTDPPSNVRDIHLPDENHRLLLLREIDPNELHLRVAPDGRDEKPAVASAPIRAPTPEPPPDIPDDEDSYQTCYRLGPALKKKRINAVRAWLDARGITATLQSERHEVLLHWVYFPPFRTHSEAEKQANRMKKSGIGDIYVLSRGNMSNAISLGVFSKRSSMEKRLDELRKKGYTPTVGERYQTKKTNWFNAVLSANATFPEVDFDKKFPSLEVKPMDCGVSTRKS
ncbi:MAG: hypothetical protein KJO08_00740 [Gammaproteobacteria bacterium]|nr:hypothetical protein [Gammaproteobacteria bacterium]NNJ84662.1 SPOR domain-containing protein [Gammaproteobacteria bacterium]